MKRRSFFQALAGLAASVPFVGKAVKAKSANPDVLYRDASKSETHYGYVSMIWKDGRFEEFHCKDEAQFKLFSNFAHLHGKAGNLKGWGMCEYHKWKLGA